MKGTILALATLLALPAVATAQEPAPQATAQAPAVTVLDDSGVLAIFDGANRRDLETSMIAVERAKDPRVRQLATRFVNEHMALRRQGQQLGSTLQLYPKREFDAAGVEKHGQAVASLKQVPAEQFDGAWLDHEIAAHAAVLEATQNTLLAAVTKPEVRALLEQAAPAFEAHLAAARDLKSSLGGTPTPAEEEPASGVGGR